MKLHLVGPYEGLSYNINQAIYMAALELGWEAEVTDPEYMSKTGGDWRGKIEGTPADLILSATLTPWHLGMKGIKTPPKFIWIREEIRRHPVRRFVNDLKGAYDHIFYFDDSSMDLIKNDATPLSYLPLATDPGVFVDLGLGRDIDISFVGRLDSLEGPFYKTRKLAIEKIREAGFKIEAKVTWDPGEISELYSRSKIVWNLGAYFEDLGPAEELPGTAYQNRVFEAMACGALLFTHKTRGENLFESGKDLVEYDGNDLVSKINYYLNNESERKNIASSGKDKVIRYHTYKQRLKEMWRIFK